MPRFSLALPMLCWQVTPTGHSAARPRQHADQRIALLLRHTIDYKPFAAPYLSASSSARELYFLATGASFRSRLDASAGAGAPRTATPAAIVVRKPAMTSRRLQGCA